ncbi:hypothetical protein D917_04136 [Trichinella nativa]|uniref:Uncharacterized protein n=1 Tax=Trichinella nativa TaxID=6335 RepID=A0A1Y3E9T4_9BILA|nr:hypothetical protein D917_04136 [Trichinella nativa]
MNKESEEVACRVTNRQTVNYLTSSNGTLWSNVAHNIVGLVNGSTFFISHIFYRNEVVNSGSVYFLLQMQ